MGAIGYTVFDDDSGADWSADFLSEPSIDKVRTILCAAESSDYLDDLHAAAALGCAEIVAAALDKPIGTMSDELLAWARANAQGLSQFGKTAINAVAAVEEKSELREIWDENPEWIEYLHDLNRRLGKGM